MGSFFTNIQVKTVGLNSFMELKEVIIGIMKNFDFDHVETPSDRAIIVSWDESNSYEENPITTGEA
jgi:hypothetical protein